MSIIFTLIANYEEAAMRTAKDMGSFEKNLIHSAMGLSSDSGEFVDCIKKFAIYGKELDRENAIEELGDVLWFIALACKTLNVSMAEVMSANIEKLAKRYPNKYSDEAAIERADKLTVAGINIIKDETLKPNEVVIKPDNRYQHQKEMDKCGDVCKFISPNYIDASNSRYSNGPYALDTAVVYLEDEVLTTIHRVYNKDIWDNWYTQGTKVPV